MKIRLAENFRAVFYAPFYATQALGLYAAEGVDVELVDSSAPGDAVSALLDGSIDLTWGGPMRVMKARDQRPDSPLVCFCEVVARDPFYLVGRARRFPACGFVAPALRDRIRGAHAVDVPAARSAPAGHRSRRLDRVADRPMADNFSALCDGRLDVVQVFEPFASMAVQQGAGDILYAASTRGPTVYTSFIATRDGIARNRAAFLAMVRAVRRMQDWLAAQGGEALAEVVAPYYPALPTTFW